jgi:hypothetical protein
MYCNFKFGKVRLDVCAHAQLVDLRVANLKVWREYPTSSTKIITTLLKSSACSSHRNFPGVRSIYVKTNFPKSY